MRVSAETRQATRERIMAAAERLFANSGWEEATTRSIAEAAKIATGTLFNYFPTKETIAATMMHTALERAEQEFRAERRPEASLEEDLFTFIWAGLRHLEPYRASLVSAIETILSPLSRPTEGHPGEPIRAAHLETVTEVLMEHGIRAPSATMLQAYWSLYLGLLAYWAADDSPRQEDTLALLDQSLRMFVSTLRGPAEAQPAGEESTEDTDERSTR